MSEISSQTISLISKSRTNLLEQLDYQGYDTNDYNEFSIEEINAMFINKQLDMTKYMDAFIGAFLKYFLYFENDEIHLNDSLVFVVFFANHGNLMFAELLILIILE